MHIARLILVLFFITVSHSANLFSEEAWERAAKYLRQAMNKNLQPCEDFYGYVCGNYGSNDESMFETTLTGKASAVATVLGDAIKKINVNNATTPRYQKAIRIFYDKCTAVGMDPQWPKQLHDAIVKRLGPIPLFEEVQRLSSPSATAPTPPFDPWYLLGRNHREMGEIAVVDATLNFVEVGCEKKLELEITPVTPPDAEVADAMNLTSVRAQVLTLARILGLNRTIVEARIDPWLARVTDLYYDWMNLSAINGEPQRIALTNMSNVLPDFNWKSYLKGLLPENVRQKFESDPKSKIYIGDKERLAAVGQMLKRHSQDAFRSFVFMKAFYSIRNEYFGKFEESQLLQDIKTPHQRCLEYALRLLSPAMARLYFDTIKVDILAWRHEVQSLGRNIFSAFRFLLNNVDWLDAEDKEKIQKKVDNIVFHPGVPAWIKDEEKLMNLLVVYNTSLDPFENEFTSIQRFFDRSSQSLVSGKQYEDDDPEPSFEVNADYDPDSSQIRMYLGLMLPPLFNISYPLPVKYGGLGVAIAHHLMHALDADGIFAGSASSHAWLKPEAFREFTKRKDCLIRQSSKYCARGRGRTAGLCQDGERAIGENMADIDGIKVALTAYKVVSQVVGTDPPIPGMLNTTHDQIFFLSVVRTWCSKNVAPTWHELKNVHAPDKSRLEIALRNVAQFAVAFGCKMGTKYVPMSADCSLWGEVDE